MLHPMDVRLIVFGMCGVLILLFVGAKFFVPKEKSNSKAEASYAEAVLKFKSNPTKENFQHCFSQAKKLPFLLQANDEDINYWLKKNNVTYSEQ